MLLKLPFALLALIAALALAGCGEDNDEGTSTGTGTGTQEEAAPTPTGPASETVSLMETEFKISPADATVADAGVVEFQVQNTGGTTHALEVEGAGLEEETEEIAPGQSASLKVDLPEGTYELYCPIDGHEDKGMKGTLVVGSGGDGADAQSDDEGESEERGEGDEGSDDSLEGEAEGKGEGEDSGGATAPGGY